MMEWSLVVADLPPRVRQEVEAMQGTIDLLNRSLGQSEKDRDEARLIACKLLYIAEHRGPKVFGFRPSWLKPDPDG